MGGIRLRPVDAVLVSFVVLALISPGLGPAQAGSTVSQFVIDRGRGNPTFPGVALDGDGDAHVLRQGSERIQAVALNRMRASLELDRSIDDLGGFATFAEPRLVSRGNALYAAWIDCCGPMGGAGVLSVSVSVDRGATFSRNLFAPGDGAWEDDIAVGPGGDLYLVWRDGPSWTSGAIAFYTLPLGGTTFAPRDLLTPSNGSRPSVAAEGGRVYVAWSADDGAILFRRSLNGGVSFDPAVALDAGRSASRTSPRLAAAPGRIYVVWQSEELDGVHLRFAMSSDRGVTFGPATDLDEMLAPRPELDPTIAIGEEGNVYVAWVSFRHFLASGLEVRPKRGSPDGTGWTEIALEAPKPSQGDQLAPALAVDAAGTTSSPTRRSTGAGPFLGTPFGS